MASYNINIHGKSIFERKFKLRKGKSNGAITSYFASDRMLRCAVFKIPFCLSKSSREARLEKEKVTF